MAMGGCDEELLQEMHAMARQEDQKNSCDVSWTNVFERGPSWHGDGGPVAFSASPYAPLLSSSNGSGRTIDVPPGPRQESLLVDFTGSLLVAHGVYRTCEKHSFIFVCMHASHRSPLVPCFPYLSGRCFFRPYLA
jgi:hypothetical protein